MGSMSKGVVLVGNTVIYPEHLRQFLQKSHYFMDYSERLDQVTLFANHGRGGQPLITINNIPYESAVKLAAGLGLESHGDYPTSWSKWNPVLYLESDGSEDAERLRMEMLRLGIPHRVYKSVTLGLVINNGIHCPPMWSMEQLFGLIRETGEKYKEELETKP